MTWGQALLLVAAALLVFWMLGAYNRLVALRNEIGDAWRAFESAMAERADAVEALTRALRPALPSEAAALDALVAARAAVQTAGGGVRPNPVRHEPLALLVQADAALEAAAARVLSLAETAPVDTTEPRAGWRQVAPRLAHARQVFNARAAAYNDAVRQWPTRWLARWFGFGTAGRL